MLEPPSCWGASSICAGLRSHRSLSDGCKEGECSGCDKNPSECDHVLSESCSRVLISLEVAASTVVGLLSLSASEQHARCSIAMCLLLSLSLLHARVVSVDNGTDIFDAGMSG